jgi:hypothetical protein
LAAYRVRISDDLDQEIRHQSHGIRNEFWAVLDQLERLGAVPSAWYGQLHLPLHEPPRAPQTRPFGNGWVTFQVVGDEVDIIHVEWPTELISEQRPASRLD